MQSLSIEHTVATWSIPVSMSLLHKESLRLSLFQHYHDSLASKHFMTFSDIVASYLCTELPESFRSVTMAGIGREFAHTNRSPECSGMIATWPNIEPKYFPSNGGHSTQPPSGVRRKASAHILASALTLPIMACRSVTDMTPRASRRLKRCDALMH